VKPFISDDFPFEDENERKWGKRVEGYSRNPSSGYTSAQGNVTGTTKKSRQSIHIGNWDILESR